MPPTASMGNGHLCRSWLMGCLQSIAQRDNAYDLQKIYGKSCRGVEADLQGPDIARSKLCN